MPWTTEQNIFIIEAYFQQKSIHAAQLQFKERFRYREFPVHSMIYRWVNKFRTHETVHNLNRKDTNRQSHYGRPKSFRTPHNVVCHLQTWHHWTILVRGWQRAVCDNQYRAICPGAWQVLDNTWSTKGVVRVLQWFQQDGATLHTSNESLAWLRQHFPDRLISRRCDPQWSPHSPHLNPQAFICGDTLRTGCMATTPRLSLTWRQQSQQQ